MKEKKKMTLGTIFLLICIITGIVIVSYSFFLPRFNENTTYDTIGQGDNPIIINYTDCGEQNQSDCATITADMIPGDSVTKTFELKNVGENDANDDYQTTTIYFKRIRNTFVNSDLSNQSATSDLRYTLTEFKTINGTTTETEIASNESVPYYESLTFNIPLIENIKLKAGETRTYELTINYINYKSVDQESNRRASFLIELGLNAGAMFDNDESGANAPNLVTNMIPIIYDEGLKEWIKTDTNQINWYNYDEQVWANAATIDETMRDYYNNASIGTIVEMNDIIGMWVWIPRYAYRIEGTYGRQLEGGNTPSQATPGAIDIDFLSGTSLDVRKGYIMHPAFVDGSKENNIINDIDYSNYVLGGWDEEITGFWYGKFESGGNTGEVLIKPNEPSLTNINVKTMSDVSFLVKNQAAISLDSHMSKNDEWGAVAYLSQSKYGKYGNYYYNGPFKEIYVNSHFLYKNFITGGSIGTYFNNSNSELENTCFYNDIYYNIDGTGACGAGASTTGNIYGIYDMNGNAWEFVMGNYDYNYGYSGWTNQNFNLSHKYFNIYNNNVKFYYGHALLETQAWYNDVGNMVYNISIGTPWYIRGSFYFIGNSSNYRTSGIFGFYNGGYHSTPESGKKDEGFRVVLT